MEHIQAQIEAQEKFIQKEKQKLAELRRQAPRKRVENYALKDSVGGDISLSSLFGNKSELILVHNMGLGCPSCTMWADGFNGLVPHLEDRASFVVESMEEAN